MIGRKTFATSTVVALIATGFIVTGCGDEAEDGDDDATGGVAGTTGGTSTGGLGGTGPTGGSTQGGTSTGGTSTGGGAGSSAGGAAGGGGGGAMGFACTDPDVANCGQINTFPNSTSQTFGNSDFSGGVSIFGDGITRDTASTDALHVTGTVAGYGRGFNIWFTLCSSLAAYGGVQFTVSGMTTDAMAPNTIDFQVQTNSDYPWQPFPASNMKGSCTAASADMAWSVCIAPGANGRMLGDMPQTVMWADVMGGMPVPFDATTSPAEVVGLQWQFPWSEGRAEYTVDVTLDNVAFVMGSGPTTECPAYMMGGGGMGGMGGMAGGGAGGDSAGMAGGGAGGAGAGMAGGGAGGAGGMGGRGGGMGGRQGGGMGGG
jgi:hypothetical protein